MFTKKYLLISILTLSLFSASLVIADVKLPSIISDNMVLQQKTNAPIWGWADPGEKIEVKASWQWLWGTKTTADQKGNWKIKLKTPSAGGPHSITIKANNKIIIKNVLIGEVWLGSGQSNMQFIVRGSNNSAEEIASANYPKIRLFTVPQKTASEPQNDCNGVWVECSPETIPLFSAAAYYFGRELHNQLKVPVGMIHSSWGGSAAEAWIKEQVLKADPAYQPIYDKWKIYIKQFPKALKEYEKRIENWEKKVQIAESKGQTPPRKPYYPKGPNHRNVPSALYNAMLSPIIPYAIKGAIWYQGESNANRAYQYRKLFPAMIKNWRDDWKQGDFSFYFVQLANYKKPSPEPVDDAWAELREAQTMTLSLPNTGMAVTIDIGDANTIHPKDKQDVGKRLALWALAKDYGKDVVFSGPLYKSMKIDGDRIIISFDYVDGGLLAKGDKPLTYFAIAGKDKKFIWADAKIVGDTVVVSTPKIKKPLAVRYAWHFNPQGCNLYNKANLPASPFRTDDWPGITINNTQP